MLAMMRQTVRRARYIIAVSESTRQNILYYLKADTNKVVVIHEGVDGRFNQQLGSNDIYSVRMKYGLEAPFLFFVGERRPHKNILGLLRAFWAFTNGHHPGYHLVVSGKPYGGYGKPERLAQALGISQQVHFVHVPETDLPAMYKAADVFVTLSHYEGFGLPVLEAMASGTPVVAANSTSLPEVVGDAGILVDARDPDGVADAIGQLITKGPQREHFRRLGYKRVRQFTWERCARKTLEIYTQAVHSA
jgi:glycosyltransferase involved in cell wall biosynthesis